MNFYRNKFMLIIFFIIILSSKAFAYDLCENIVNAAWRGDYENVKSLIERGANPNCEFANKSVLFAASRYGRQFHWDENIEVVKLLVKYGADVNHKSFQNSEVLTPAYIAALFHHTKTALFLVDNGASLKDVEQGYLDRLKSEKASAASIELLGNLFNAAFNVPKDNDVANGYKSFKNGYMEEMENLVKEEVALADNCYDNKNYERAMYWFKAAAKWENTYAKYSLAHMYYYGLGGEKQWGKALKLLQNTTYVKGTLIQGLINLKYSNYQDAVYYINKAATNGDEEAQEWLGSMYINGKQGLKQDDELGYAWLIIASENGNKIAKNYIIDVEKYYGKQRIEEIRKLIVPKLRAKIINNK